MRFGNQGLLKLKRRESTLFESLTCEYVEHQKERGSRQNFAKLEGATQEITIRNEIAFFPGIEEAAGTDEGIFVRFVGKNQINKLVVGPRNEKTLAIA